MFYEVFTTILFFVFFFILYCQEKKYEQKLSQQRCHFEERLNLMHLAADCEAECRNIVDYYCGKLPSEKYRTAIAETVRTYAENPNELYQGKYKAELSDIPFDAWNDYRSELSRIEAVYLKIDSCTAATYSRRYSL